MLDRSTTTEASREPGCVFCQIVAGRVPASVVHAEETVLAFLDVRPLTPGHVLVIPTRHAPLLADLDEATGMLMFRTAMRLDQALRRAGVRCEGVNLFLADGAVAGQEVFHAHLHVLPRYAGDPFGPGRPLRAGPAAPVVGDTPPRAELDAVAERLRRAYAETWGDDR